MRFVLFDDAALGANKVEIYTVRTKVKLRIIEVRRRFVYNRETIKHHITYVFYTQASLKWQTWSTKCTQFFPNKQ